MDDSTAALASAIGGRVRQERQARGWTLDRLAEAAGVSRRMLVNVEQGTVNPSVGTLLRISDALAREPLHPAGSHPLVDDGADPLETARAEERLVDVVDDVGEVHVAVVVHPGHGLLGAERADAHEVHPDRVPQPAGTATGRLSPRRARASVGQ